MKRTSGNDMLFKRKTLVPQRIALIPCPGVNALINEGKFLAAAETIFRAKVPFNLTYIYLSNSPETLSEYIILYVNERTNGSSDQNEEIRKHQAAIAANVFVTIYPPLLLKARRVTFDGKMPAEYENMRLKFIAFVKKYHQFIPENLIDKSLRSLVLIDVLRDVYQIYGDWEQFISLFLETYEISKMPLQQWRDFNASIMKIPNMKIRQKIYKSLPVGFQKSLLKRWVELDLKKELSKTYLGKNPSAVTPIFPMLIDLVYQEPEDIQINEILQPIFDELLRDRLHGLNTPYYVALYYIHLMRTNNKAKLNDLFNSPGFRDYSIKNSFFLQHIIASEAQITSRRVRFINTDLIKTKEKFNDIYKCEIPYEEKESVDKNERKMLLGKKDKRKKTVMKDTFKNMANSIFQTGFNIGTFGLNLISGNKPTNHVHVAKPIIDDNDSQAIGPLNLSGNEAKISVQYKNIIPRSLSQPRAPPKSVSTAAASSPTLLEPEKSHLSKRNMPMSVNNIPRIKLEETHEETNDSPSNEAEQPENVEHEEDSEQPEEVEHSDAVEQSEHVEETEQTENVEETEQTENVEETEPAEQTEQEKSNEEQAEKSEVTIVNDMNMEENEMLVEEKEITENVGKNFCAFDNDEDDANIDDKEEPSVAPISFTKEEENDQTENKNNEEEEAQQTENKNDEGIDDEIREDEKIIKKNTKIRTQEEEREYIQRKKEKKEAYVRFKKLNEHSEISILDYSSQLCARIDSARDIAIQHAFNYCVNMNNKSLNLLTDLLTGPLKEEADSIECQKRSWVRALSFVYDLYMNTQKFNVFAKYPTLASVLNQLCRNIESPELVKMWKLKIDEYFNVAPQYKDYIKMRKIFYDKNGECAIVMDQILNGQEEDLAKNLKESVSQNVITALAKRIRDGIISSNQIKIIWNGALRQRKHKLLNEGAKRNVSEETKNRYKTERLNITALSQLPEDVMKEIVRFILYESNEIASSEDLKKSIDCKIETYKQNANQILDLVTNNSKKVVLSLISIFNDYTSVNKKLTIEEVREKSAHKFEKLVKKEIKFFCTATSNVDTSFIRYTYDSLKNYDYEKFKDALVTESSNLHIVINGVAKIRGSNVINLAKIVNESDARPEKVWAEAYAAFKEKENNIMRQLFNVNKTTVLMNYDETIVKELFANKEKENSIFISNILAALNEKFKVYNNILRIEGPILGSFLEQIKVSAHPVEERFADALQEFKNTNHEFLKEKLVSFKKFQPYVMTQIVLTFDKVKGNEELIKEKLLFDKEHKVDVLTDLRKNWEHPDKEKFNKPLCEAVANLNDNILKVIVNIFNKKIDSNSGSFVSLWSDSMSDFIDFVSNFIKNECQILEEFDHTIIEALRPTLETQPKEFNTQLEEFTKKLSFLYSQIYIINDHVLSLIVNNLVHQDKKARNNKYKKRWQLACETFLSFSKHELPSIYNDLKKCEDDTIEWFVEKFKTYRTISVFDFIQYSQTKGQSFRSNNRLFSVIKGNHDIKDGSDSRNNAIFTTITHFFLNKFFSEELEKIHDKRERWVASLNESIEELAKATTWIKTIKTIKNCVADVVVKKFDEVGSSLTLNKVVEDCSEEMMEKYAKIHALPPEIISYFSICLTTKKRVITLSWKDAVKKMEEGFQSASDLAVHMKEFPETVSSKIYDFLKVSMTGKGSFDLLMKKFERDIDSNFKNFKELGLNKTVFLANYIVHESIEDEEPERRWQIAIDWFANSTSIINKNAIDNFEKFDQNAKEFVVRYVDINSRVKNLDGNIFKKALTQYVNHSARQYSALLKEDDLVINEIKNGLSSIEKWADIFSKKPVIPFGDFKPNTSKLESAFISHVLNFLDESYYQLICCFDQFAFNCNGPIFLKLDVNLLRMITDACGKIYVKPVLLGSNTLADESYLLECMESRKKYEPKDEKKAKEIIPPIADYWDTIIKTYLDTFNKWKNEFIKSIKEDESKSKRKINDDEILLLYDALLDSNYKDVICDLADPLGKPNAIVNTLEFLKTCDRNFIGYIISRLRIISELLRRNLKMIVPKILNPLTESVDDIEFDDQSKVENKKVLEMKFKSHYFVSFIDIPRKSKSGSKSGNYNEDDDDDNLHTDGYELNKSQQTLIKTISYKLLIENIINNDEIEEDVFMDLISLDENQYTVNSDNNVVLATSLRGNNQTIVDLINNGRKVKEFIEDEAKAVLQEKIRLSEIKKRKELIESMNGKLAKEITMMANQLDIDDPVYKNVSDDQMLRFLRPEINPEQLRLFENSQSNFAPVKNASKKLKTKWPRYISEFIKKTSSTYVDRLVIGTKTHVLTSKDYTRKLERIKEAEKRKAKLSKKDEMLQSVVKETAFNPKSYLKLRDFDIAMIQRFSKIYSDSCSSFYAKVNEAKTLIENVTNAFVTMDHIDGNSKHQTQYEILKKIIDNHQGPIDKASWKEILSDFKREAEYTVTCVKHDIENLKDSSITTFVNNFVKEIEKASDSNSTQEDIENKLMEVKSNFEEKFKMIETRAEKAREISEDSWDTIRVNILHECKDEAYSRNIIGITLKNYYNIDQMLEDKSILMHLSEFGITEASKNDENKFIKDQSKRSSSSDTMEEKIIAREEDRECEELKKLLKIYTKTGQNYERTIFVNYSVNASKVVDIKNKEEDTVKSNSKDSEKYKLTLGNWLMQSHVEERIIDGFKRATTILVPDPSWQRLLQEALLSNVVRLDDIIPFIPRKMELEFLNQQIIESVFSYQSSNRASEATINELKERFSEQQKKLETRNENEIEVDPSCYCEFCKEPIYQGRFIVYPCHHAVHIKCFLDNMDLYFSPADQLNLIALQSSATKKASDKEELINELSKSCPMCGEISINALNKGFTIEDTEEEKQWDLI